jgi:hypothetical protein
MVVHGNIRPGFRHENFSANNKGTGVSNPLGRSRFLVVEVDMGFFGRLMGKKPGFNELLDKFHGDPRFREHLESNLEEAIRPFQLSPEERETIRNNTEKKRENYTATVFREIVDKYKDYL